MDISRHFCDSVLTLLGQPVIVCLYSDVNESEDGFTNQIIECLKLECLRTESCLITHIRDCQPATSGRISSLIPLSSVKVTLTCLYPLQPCRGVLPL